MDAQVGCPKGGTEDRLSFSQETHWAVQPSPHRAQYLCVCVCQDEEGRVGLRGGGAIITCVLLLLREAQRLPPPRG